MNIVYSTKGLSFMHFALKIAFFCSERLKIEMGDISSEVQSKTWANFMMVNCEAGGTSNFYLNNSHNPKILANPIVMMA